MKLVHIYLIRFVAGITLFLMFSGCTHTIKSANIPTLQTGSPLKGIDSKTFAFKNFQGNRQTYIFGGGLHKYVLDQPVEIVVAMLIRKELERNGQKCIAYSPESNPDFIIEGRVYQYFVGTRGLNSFGCNVALNLAISRASAVREVLAKSYQGEYYQAHKWGGHEPIDVSNQAMLAIVKEISTDPELIAFLESRSPGNQGSLTRPSPSPMPSTPLQFKLGKETFSSKEKALARFDKQVDESLSGISPTKTPLHGTAAVVIATVELIQKTAIKIGNVPENTRKEVLDYLSKYRAKDLESQYRAIEKRQIFDKVNLVRSPTPDDDSVGTDDYLIYYNDHGLGLGQWYVKGKDWSSPRPVNSNKAIPAGTQRTVSWLDDLEEAIRGGAPK